MFKKFINEVTISTKKADVQFSVADIDTPFVKDMMAEIANRTGKSYDDVVKEVTEKDAKMRANLEGPDRLFKVQKMNSVESVLFGMLPNSTADKLDERTFNYMFKAIIAKNKTFLKIEDRITGKRVRFNVILTPQPPFVKQPNWVKGVTTAAASPEGDVVFNKDFANKLIAYATVKGVKAKGSMYVSNGGTVPDSYAYIEFLILHEIYHIIHADHFQQSRTPGMTPKLQNYLGDYITDYNLVKAGYTQLPIGLFSNDYNFDKFKTMVDMQKAIIEDFKDIQQDQEKQMDDQMDDHMDKDHNQTNKQEQQGDSQEQQQDKQDKQEGGQDSQEQQDDNKDSEKGGEEGNSSDEQPDDSEKDDSNQGKGDGEEQQDDVEDSKSGSDSKSDKGDEQEDSDSEESKGKPDKGEPNDPKDSDGTESDDKSLEDSFKNADENLEDADDGMTQEELDQKIKDAEAEKNAESEKMRQDKLDNLEKEREKREQNLKELNDKIEGAKPVDWKKLIKAMMPKEKETAEESLTKMHRRTVGQLALGQDKVSVKAGEIKGALPTQSLLFILDSSGSMSGVINDISNELLRLIDKNKTFGIEYMYILRFDSSYDLYRVNLDMKGNKHTYQPLMNPMDIISKKGAEIKLKGTAKPIKELFQMRWGAGTVFPDEIFKIVKALLDEDFNQVIFTDTDIIGGSNLVNLARACKLGMKKAYSFNIILDSKSSYGRVKQALGGSYKYMTYLGEDINK